MTPPFCGPPRSGHWPPFRGGAGRPPWWPDDEPWPPAGPPGTGAWRRIRRHFFRRAVVFLAAVVVLTAGVSTLVQWGVASLLGLPGRAGGAGGAAVLLAVFVVVLVGAIGAARAFRRIAAPVGDLMAALAQVADGDYATRVRERGPQEARTLTRAFNAMAERLERQNERRRNLLMDISHELRTPLAVLQGNLEGLLDGVYPRDDAHLSLILEETQVLGRLVEDLRTLTLAESSELRLARTPTDLAVVVRDAIASFQRQAHAAGVTLAVMAESGLPSAEVDPERIHQVLTNVLANALRYTPRGGTITMRCAPGETGQAVLSVEDTGSGIPADELPHVFDRFHKSQDSRGTGLGLAIAGSLVKAHGGEISAESAPGQGTRIRLTLPLHPDS